MPLQNTLKLEVAGTSLYEIYNGAQSYIQTINFTVCSPYCHDRKTLHPCVLLCPCVKKIQLHHTEQTQNAKIYLLLFFTKLEHIVIFIFLGIISLSLFIMLCS